MIDLTRVFNAKPGMRVKFDYNGVPRNGIVHERYGGGGYSRVSNPIHLVLQLGSDFQKQYHSAARDRGPSEFKDFDSSKMSNFEILP